MGSNGRDFEQKYLPSQVGCQCALIYGQQKYGNDINGGGNNNSFRKGGGGNNNRFRNNKQNNNELCQQTHQAKMATQMPPMPYGAGPLPMQPMMPMMPMPGMMPQMQPMQPQMQPMMPMGNM